MKQVISGRLAETPELKTIYRKETGEGLQVVQFKLLALDPGAPEIEKSDGSSDRKGIPLRCSAWGENARRIAQMKEGETMTASTTMRYSEHLRNDGSKAVEPNYVVKRLDPDHQIQNQMAELLNGYEEGQYDQIFVKEAQPEFSSLIKTQGQTRGQEREAGRESSGERDGKGVEL